VSENHGAKEKKRPAQGLARRLKISGTGTASQVEKKRREENVPGCKKNATGALQRRKEKKKKKKKKNGQGRSHKLARDQVNLCKELEKKKRGPKGKRNEGWSAESTRAAS